MSICRIELSVTGAGDHGDIVDPTFLERGPDQCFGTEGGIVPMGKAVSRMRSSVNIFVRPSEQSSNEIAHRSRHREKRHPRWWGQVPSLG